MAGPSQHAVKRKDVDWIFTIHHSKAKEQQQQKKELLLLEGKESVCQVASILLHSQAQSLPVCYLSSLTGWKQTGIIDLNHLCWEKQMKNIKREDPRKGVSLLLSSLMLPVRG